MSAIQWADIPPQPWPSNVEPTAEQLATWLTSLGREHLVWVLGTMRVRWNEERVCFEQNHVSHIEWLERRVRELVERLDASVSSVTRSNDRTEP